MSIDSYGAWVVTLDDGTLVRCRVGKVGREGKYPEYIRTRWIFQAVIDGESVESIGPFFTPIDHEGQLRALVQEWWATSPYRRVAGCSDPARLNSMRLRRSSVIDG